MRCPLGRRAAAVSPDPLGGDEPPGAAAQRCESPGVPPLPVRQDEATGSSTPAETSPWRMLVPRVHVRGESLASRLAACGDLPSDAASP